MSILLPVDLSPQQRDAVREIILWLRAAPRPKPYFQLRGPAGTGKTAIAAFLAARLNGPVVFGAYTGKAAAVMRQRGCEGATTLHQLIYTPFVEPDGRVRFVRNPHSVLTEARLVIVDEVSMVDEAVARDLLSFGRPVLVLGDPAQLPPAKGQGYFNRFPADFELNEIHRQAKGSPIIELATAARNGVALALGRHGTSRVVELAELDNSDLLGADQVLVGTNETRRFLNGLFRELLGRGSVLPEIGDRVVATKNDHDKGVLNGVTYRVVSVTSNRKRPECLDLQIVDEAFPSGDPLKVTVHSDCFRFGPENLDWAVVKGTQLFDYAYALTVHKAQGSQWKHVVVFDEGHVFRDDEAKWRYTAITRAEERVTIIKH